MKLEEMKTKILILAIVGIILVSAFFISQLLKPEAPEVAKELPASYQLSLSRVYTGGGLCYLGSFAMLAKHADPNLSFSDVVAYSGVGTHAKFWPHVGQLNNGYMEGSIINAAKNLGYNLVLGIGSGAKTDRFMEATSETKSFNSQNEALNYLKYVIASNTPVVVHLNLYYIKDDLDKVSKLWSERPHRHYSHFMVVTGYDGGHVYLNDPGEPETSLASESIILDHFLEAWAKGADEAVEGARLGPYWMVFIKSGGMMKSDSEIKEWNKQISTDTAFEIRKFAKSSPSKLNVLFVTELANGRREFAAFLRKTGSDEAATLYEKAAELYLSLPGSDNLITDLNTIANLEERARQLY